MRGLWVGVGAGHVLCLLFLFGAFIFSWERGSTVPFGGGRETKERNTKQSSLSCKHNI